MAIKITNTQDYALNGVKCMVYSRTGVGKTTLCATAPAPLIISNESGLLSLANYSVPVIEVNSIETIGEAYRFLTQSQEARAIQTICVDSVSELAEVVLTQYKGQFSDGRQAYGKMNDDIAEVIRLFRDIKGKNVYFTAKLKRFVDEDTGITTYIPSMPGKTLLGDLPYFFDEVFSLQIGVMEDGTTTYRYLQTTSSIKYEGKDRSGKLAPYEPANLSHIFTKIIQPKAQEK